METGLILEINYKNNLILNIVYFKKKTNTFTNWTTKRKW